VKTVKLKSLIERSLVKEIKKVPDFKVLTSYVGVSSKKQVVNSNAPKPLIKKLESAEATIQNFTNIFQRCR
jgi:hypothetical protein